MLHIHNHLDKIIINNKSGPMKTGPTGVVDTSLLIRIGLIQYLSTIKKFPIRASYLTFGGRWLWHEDEHSFTLSQPLL